MSSICDTSIEIILHFIKTKLLPDDPPETVSVVKNILGWKSSTLLLTRGRKLSLTTKGQEKVEGPTLTMYITVVF